MGIGDLVGMRVRVLRHANDETDRVRATLLEHGGIDVVDEEIFDVALLDDAMDRGDAVITSGAWSGIHPGLIGVPFEWDSRVPCYLAYPLDPTPQVERFVRGVGRAIAADIARCAR